MGEVENKPSAIRYGLVWRLVYHYWSQ